MQDVGWEYLVFPGDGEMVRQMREYPWQEPALGDPRDWSFQVWSEIWDTIGPMLAPVLAVSGLDPVTTVVSAP